MSFADVKKTGGSRRPQTSSTSSWQPSISETRAASSSPGSTSLAQISDGILQYQRNVGILENLARQIGTQNDGEELRTQFDVQADVVNQLGQRLENSLMKLERDASVVKLKRDFHRIEASYKNILVEAKKRKSRVAANSQPRNIKSSAYLSQNNGRVEDEEQIQLQLQMQQDRLNEEIMRERESEIRNINRGMHQVNEIYKDLAHIVGSQQEQIDQVETQMEESKVNAEQGLAHIQKANAKNTCTIS